MIFVIKKNIKRLLANGKKLDMAKNICPPNGVRILLYHSVGGLREDHPLGIRVPLDGFESQVEILYNRGYKSLTITQLIKGASTPHGDKKIAITFDDGYKDNIAIAAEVLNKFKFKATFFVCTSYIDKQVRKTWRGGRPREFMDWEDIRRLSEMGFEIGSHMVHHQDLTALGEDGLNYEFRHSKEVISEKTGRPVEVFSYPHGKLNSKVVEAARNSSYLSGCSSFTGLNDPSTDKYVLKRTEIDGYDSDIDFSDKLEGLYD